MAKIIIFKDGAFLGDYLINKKRTLVGRLSYCDIQIDSIAVSGEHATISHLFGKFSLADMGSTNGTLLNSQPVEKAMLKHHDVIEIGNYRLKFSEQDADVSYANFEQTVLVKKETKKTSETNTAPAKQISKETAKELGKEPNNASQNAPQNAPISQAEPIVLDPNIVAPYMVNKVKARVVVMSGTNQGRALQLDKARIPIGWPGVQVAEVIKNAQGYFIKHVEGLNHPIVNGKNIGPQYQLLNHADEFELAGVKMMISIEEHKNLFARVGDFFKNFF